MNRKYSQKMENKYYNLRSRKINLNFNHQIKENMKDRKIRLNVNSENNKRYNLRNRKVNVNNQEKENKIILENEKGITKEEKEFKNNTIDPNNFYIEDVLGDNACFYRCVSNIIHYLNNINKNKDTDFLGFDSEKQEKMARKIQKLVAKWLYKNKDNIVENLGISVKEFVIHTHDLLEDYDCDNYKGTNLYDDLMIEYLRRYSKFAGDPHSTEYDRWGGAAEQYAISEIFKIPVYTYVYKKYNKQNGKIENGRIRKNKPEKGVRFKLYQVFGIKYLDKKSMHLLYKNTQRCDGHYLCLYKKN